MLSNCKSMFKVIQGHCYSIGYIGFPISLTLQLTLCRCYYRLLIETDQSNSGNSDELEWPSRSFTYCKPLQMRFLPRDAILARYMLSSCVRLSVRPSHAGIVPYNTLVFNTGPPTHSVRGQYCFALLRLSSSAVCRLSSFVTLHNGPSGGFTRAGQAMTSCRLQSNYGSTITLHGGPVVLRPVKATPCFKMIYWYWYCIRIKQRTCEVIPRNRISRCVNALTVT